MHFPMFPPHPASKLKIVPDRLDEYERTNDYVAQRKFNGTHVVVEISTEGEVDIWNRHGEHLTLYKLTKEMQECFLSLPGFELGKRYIFGGELLHSKAKSKITNTQAAMHTIVLFDIYFAGRYLLNWSQMERLGLLSEICGNPKELEPKSRGLIVRQVGESQLWLAEVFADDFSYRFYEMYEFDNANNDKYPEIEGLVLRVKDSRLPQMSPTPKDVNWIVRCRKEKKCSTGGSMYPF